MEMNVTLTYKCESLWYKDLNFEVCSLYPKYIYDY